MDHLFTLAPPSLAALCQTVLLIAATVGQVLLLLVALRQDMALPAARDPHASSRTPPRPTPE